MNIRAAIYCRVGSLEELSSTDMKEDSIIVQNNKKSIDKLTNLFPNLDSSEHLWYNYSYYNGIIVSRWFEKNKKFFLSLTWQNQS